MLNKFNRSFDGVKKFLRLVSYGCRHRQLFGRCEIKPRSYDDFIRQMRFFIPEDKIQVSYHKKFAYFTFAGDFRRGSDNYLHRAFLTKTILPETCLQYIVILQVLRSSAEPLTSIEIIERVSEVLPSIAEHDFFQLIRRRLNELTDAGLMSKIGSGNRIRYRQINNPLEKISSEERRALSTALHFYRNYSLLSMPGYLLSKNLELDGADEIFQFRNNNFTRILDDDFVFTIVQALGAPKKLLLDRFDKPPLTVIPLSIETDFLYSRQYLTALKELGKRLEPVRLRLDKIKLIKPASAIETKTPSPSQRLREILLRVTFDNDAQRLERADILNARFETRLIEEGADYFICAIRMLDPLQVYPWLWNVQPWAEILSEGLRTRMQFDVSEALKNYADAV